MKSSSELERIENVNIQIGDVGGVACHQRHAVDFGGCRQQAVAPRAHTGLDPDEAGNSQGVKGCIDLAVTPDVRRRFGILNRALTYW